MNFVKILRVLCIFFFFKCEVLICSALLDVSVYLQKERNEIVK